MPKFITAEQVSSALPMAACIDLMCEALISLSSSVAKQIVRPVLPLDGRNVLGMMPAFEPFSGTASVKVLGDGNIGMWGASYLGYTTTAAATSGHPNLEGASNEVNVGSSFFQDTVRRGGALCSWPLLC